MSGRNNVTKRVKININTDCLLYGDNVRLNVKIKILQTYGLVLRLNTLPVFI